MRASLLAAVAALALTSAAAAQEGAPPTSPARQDSLPPPSGPPTIQLEDAPDDNATAGVSPASPTEVAIPAVWAPAPTDAQGNSVYGLVLAARSAQRSGALDEQAALIARAQALAPEQPSLTQEAFVTALFNGDLAVAARLAPEGSFSEPLFQESGRLAGVVTAFSKGDARRAWRDFQSERFGSIIAIPAAYMRPHLAAAARDRAAVRAGGPGEEALPGIQLLRATALERLGDRSGAEAEYRALMAGPLAAAARTAYGAFLERINQRPAAIALYDQGLAATPDDASLKAARDRAAARGRPPALTSHQRGAAEGLMFAAELVNRQPQGQEGQSNGAQELRRLFLRMAVELDPGFAGARLSLAEALAASQLEDQVRSVLSAIPAGDPAYVVARQEIAASLSRSEREGEALAELRKAAAVAPDDPVVKLNLVGQLLTVGASDEALKLVEDPAIQGIGDGFIGRYYKGLVLEDLGRFTEAETELRAALALQPENAELQNNLGYLLIDKLGKVDEGAELVSRAFRDTPDSGHVQDSLGWAQFRRGEFEKAVETLEEAVAKVPASAEINEHLGDALWKVGRQREARFRWTRVLTLEEADAERKARVENKIAAGLP